MEVFLQEIISAAERIVSVTFSGPARGAAAAGSAERAPSAPLSPSAGVLIPVPAGQLCVKIKIRPSVSSAVNNRSGGTAFYAEFFTEKQAFHRTLDADSLAELIRLCAGFLFKNTVIQLRSDDSSSKMETVSVLANKKGKVRIVRSAARISDAGQPVSSGENRRKQYLLPEGVPVPFLVFLGVMTPDGKVVQSKRDKFRQINRFLEYIDDILPAVLKLTGPVSESRPLRVADFGCGKSYLTFAVFYYLNEVKRIHAEVAGLDLKDEVIADCASLAAKLKCAGLTFRRGDISGYADIQTAGPPDIVITLHACDTATDYALSYAVKCSAAAVLSVPCCQHEVNAQLDSGCVLPIFEPLLKYGLIKDRFASLVTDAVRAQLLEQAGYSVQVLEFVDMGATAKNLLIRAVRKTIQPVSSKDGGAHALTDALHVRMTLQSLLPEQGQGSV